MSAIRIASIVVAVGAGIGSSAAADIAAGAQLAIAAVRAPTALEDAACEFASKPEQGVPHVAPLVVSRNLDCDIWVNVDGVDQRLPSSERGVCDRGWDLPSKGQRVRRTYGFILRTLTANLAR